jgi:alpha-1,6-mannosyltransferase
VRTGGTEENGTVKVCDLALFSPDTSSGVKTYITSKIDYVSRRPDVDHVVIVPGPEERTDVQGRSRLVMVRGVPSFYPGIRIGLNIGRIAGIVEREAPDLIELNCQYTLPWAAFLATRRRRTPIVGIYHTDVPACVRHMMRGAGRLAAASAERLTEFYEGLIYRHCTTTVILNAAMRHRIERLGVDRIRCLPCGVDVATFTPDRRDAGFRARHGIAPDQRILLYVGRLSQEKELDVLFAASERLQPKDFVLLVAGDGPDAAAVTRRAAGTPGVMYLGHVESRSELADLYASSDIFVVPGRYETFGMATLEALSSGLPVVGIRESGTAAVVLPEVGLLARAGDPADLAEAIAEVATWPLDRLRNECHDFAARTYSWDAVFGQYFSLYRELVDASAGRVAAA